MNLPDMQKIEQMVLNKYPIKKSGYAKRRTSLTDFFTRAYRSQSKSKEILVHIAT